MKIIVLADTASRSELLSDNSEHLLIRIKDINQLREHAHADAVIDLDFQHDQNRIQLLKAMSAETVLINSVIDTLAETDAGFVRFNGWDGFLSGRLIEASASDNKRRKTAAVMDIFQKEIRWLPDEPGFVSARVVSMIVNEAYLLLEEGGSTREDINLAMRLGTNYPFGPFEWADKIGVQKINSLLLKLAVRYPHYQPCRLLALQASPAE